MFLNSSNLHASRMHLINPHFFIFQPSLSLLLLPLILAGVLTSSPASASAVADADADAHECSGVLCQTLLLLRHQAIRKQQQQQPLFGRQQQRRSGATAAAAADSYEDFAAGDIMPRKYDLRVRTKSITVFM